MQPAPTFSLAYTSVRPQRIPIIVEAWTRAAWREDLEWVISVDEGDEDSRKAAEACVGQFGVPVRVVINTGPKNCSSGWNTACAATTGKVIIAVADDFRCPDGWDEALRALQPEGWMDADHAVHVDDGYVHNLMVLPIVTRKRYERFGYLYYPKYQSLFGDTEITEVAYREGVVIDAKHLLFEHCHPDCGKRNRDHVDLVHGSTERWNTGEMLFNFRRARGFPIDDGPKAQAAASTPAAKESDLRFAVYMQVTQDDLCLAQVCDRLVEEGLRDFFFAVPDSYWSGEPVPAEKQATLTPVYARLHQQGCHVHIKHCVLEPYRIGCESRLTLETRVRNDSLAWVRSKGFQHVLIVDGDELWLPGTLETIKPFIAQGCAAVSVRMIPVMGTPGYPVDNAKDVAVVYIGPDCYFKSCRTPTARQAIIDQACIIHFTSTRRTHEENVAKHRRSGHYDDPAYAFEKWIQEKLPQAKPGLKDAHMYTGYSIWPSLRRWRPEELAVIPKELHAYLGLD